MLAAAKRVEHESRLHDERRRAERGKSLIVLVLHHLAQSGYVGSIEALQSESGVTLSQYEAADNVDLVSILQEWEDYYEFRFSRRAKLVKKLSAYSNRVDPHGPRVCPPAHPSAAAPFRNLPPHTPSLLDCRPRGAVSMRQLRLASQSRRARPPSEKRSRRSMTATTALWVGRELPAGVRGRRGAKEVRAPPLPSEPSLL